MSGAPTPRCRLGAAAGHSTRIPPIGATALVWQRCDTPEAVSRLDCIRPAHESGFDVAAIRELLVLSVQRERPCAEADEIARRHMAAVEKRIGQLMALRAELQRMVAMGSAVRNDVGRGARKRLSLLRPAGGRGRHALVNRA